MVQVGYKEKTKKGVYEWTKWEEERVSMGEAILIFQVLAFELASFFPRVLIKPSTSFDWIHVEGW